MRRFVSGLLITLALTQASFAQQSPPQYRLEQDAVVRSTDGGQTWQTVLMPVRPRFYWLVADTEHPENVCIYYEIIDIAAGSNVVECSWNSGDSWHRFPAGRVDFEIMPFYVNDLTVDPASPDSLLLTAYDRVFRLDRGEGDELLVTTVEALDYPPACQGFQGSRVCAELALEGHPAVWFDPEQSGQGLTVVPVQGHVWGYLTLYDEAGDAHWYLFQFTPFTITRPGGLQVNLLEFSGPPLGSDWDTALLQSRLAGTAFISFLGPEQMRFSYEVIIGSTVELNLVPFQ